MQYKNEFDKETVEKIKKSFIWALSGPIGVALIDLATKAPKDAWWGVLIAYLLPILINVVKEYRKGEI